MKQAFVAGPRQPAVEEQRRGGENDAAECVMLVLIGGSVTHAHRPVIVIALEVGGDPSRPSGRRHDAVDRPQGSSEAMPRMKEINPSIVLVAPSRLSAFTTK